MKKMIKTRYIVIAGILTAMMLLPNFPVVKEIRLRMSLMQVSAHPENQTLETLDEILALKEQIDGDVTLREEANVEVNRIIKENGWNELETDMEKVEAVNSWVKKNIKYTWDESDTNWEMRKYGNSTLLSGYGDCCGYSRVIKMLLDELCIECHTIRLQYKTEVPEDQLPVDVFQQLVNVQHAVSVARVGDQWYVLDGTKQYGNDMENPITPEEFAKTLSNYRTFFGIDDNEIYHARYWPTDTVAKEIGMSAFEINVPEF